jgi:predicted Zn finger-like uncharacterized protein
MALATTCPRCQTGFRVVPDQLKIRRGLVRCGHCRHVFSGLDSLRYVGDTVSAPMPAGSPPPPAAATPQAVAPVIAQRAPGRSPEARPGDVDLDTPETLLVPDLADEVAAAQRRPAPIRDDFVLEGLDELDELEALAVPPTEGSPADSPGPLHVSTEAASGRQEALDQRPASAEPPASGASAAPRPAQAAGMPEDPSAAWSAAVLAPGPDERRGGGADIPAEAVDFFASPSRAGGFTSRGNAIAAVACGALGIALAVQVAIVGRDWLVARVPAIEAGLGAAATLLGTTITPPRQLAALTLESFDVHAGATSQALVLNALLRNQAPHRVRWPSMELTLTDAAGTVIVRTVLSPGEYLAAAQVGTGVPPERELPLQVALEAVGIQPSGYNVKLFYP